MAFIGGGDSKTTTTLNLDNSVDDHSVNTNNAGAIQSGGGNISFTDGGAIAQSVDLAKTALKSNQSALDLSLQTATGAIDHSLAVAAEATRSDGQAVMQTVTKVGIAVAVVVVVAMIIGRNK